MKAGLVAVLVLSLAGAATALADDGPPPPVPPPPPPKPKPTSPAHPVSWVRPGTKYGWVWKVHSGNRCAPNTRTVQALYGILCRTNDGGWHWRPVLVLPRGWSLARPAWAQGEPGAVRWSVRTGVTAAMRRERFALYWTRDGGRRWYRINAPAFEGCDSDPVSDPGYSCWRDSIRLGYRGRTLLVTTLTGNELASCDEIGCGQSDWFRIAHYALKGWPPRGRIHPGCRRWRNIHGAVGPSAAARYGNVCADGPRNAGMRLVFVTP